MMNRCYSIFLLILLASCANPYEKAHRDGERVRARIDDPRAVLEVSFLSPEEPGWVKEIMSDNIVTLQKGNSLSDENQEIEVYITERNTSNQFEAISTQQTKRYIQHYFDGIKEYSLQKLEVKEYPEDNQCIRTHILLKDMRNTKSSKPTRWSEQHALSCIFPTHQHMGFEIRFYQRYHEQNKDNRFINKADALFKSLKVMDRKANWIWRL